MQSIILDVLKENPLGLDLDKLYKECQEKYPDTRMLPKALNYLLHINPKVTVINHKAHPRQYILKEKKIV